MTEPATTDATPPRKKLFSRAGWIFIAVCALAAPLLLGVLPTSFGRAIAYFMIAWMAAFFAGGALMVFGGSDRNAPPPRNGPDDGSTPPA